MSADFDINDVEEIFVRFADGREVVYKGRGLEKFRRLVSASPAYGEEVNVKATTIVIETNSDEDEDAEPEPVVVKKKSTSTKKTAKKKSGPKVGPNGYHQADLNYAPPAASKGRSPMDMAREMQREAEKSSGMKF